MFGIGPRLHVAEDAQQRVDVKFDMPTYMHYLHKRNVPKEAITKLRLIVTNNIAPTARATYASPAESSTKEHEISFSPNNMPRSIAKQGDVLRHETEHFIDAATNGYWLSVISRYALLVTLAGAGALYFGAVCHRLGDSTSPAELRTVLDDAGTAIGAFSGLVSGIGATKTFMPIRPGEQKAVHAESDQRHALPDGTIAISFR